MLQMAGYIESRVRSPGIPIDSNFEPSRIEQHV